MRTISIVAFISILFVSLQAGVKKVPQDYAKIQLAINAAVNGDTVLVDEGTYIENIRITKKIVFGSLFLIDKDTSHISKTIIDGSGATNPDSGTVVVLGTGTDSTTLVTGFTITNGTGMKLPWGNYNTRYGGGVVLTEFGGGIIRKNIISNNEITVPFNAAGGAAGIAVAWSTSSSSRSQRAIIEDNIIENNMVVPTSSTSQTEVGGIGVWQGYCRITDNLIRNNTVQWLHPTSSCTGGGILVDSESGGNDSMFVIGNIVVGNKSRQGGGITVAGNGTRAIIHSNTVIGNTGDYAGGGIFLFYQLVNAKVTNNYISGNASPRGGGIRIDQTGTCYIANNIITQNTASISGGGVNLNASSSIQLVNNTIVGNSNYGIEAVTGAYAHALNNIIWNNTLSPMTGTIYSLNNLTTDPKFTPNDSLYPLSATSPAIGAGSASATVGGVQLTAPVKDYAGSSRPNPSWSNPDLGAMESSQAFPGGNAIRVPQDQSTIQKGIDAAKNGDVVLVSEGTYTENLVINKKITVASLFFQDKDTSHISKTIVDGSGSFDPDSGATITLGTNTDTTLVITGFTITGGKGNKTIDVSDNSLWIGGGGIESSVGGSARISHNIITRNRVDVTGAINNVYAGGIGITALANSVAPYVIIESNTISGNVTNGTTTEAGGIGLYVVQGRIEGNIIENNSAVTNGNYCRGGGMLIGLGSSITLTGNLIRGNSSTLLGGGIFFNGYPGQPSTLMMYNNIVWGNTAGSGAGMRIGQYSTSQLINNTFAANSGGLTGNGIAVVSASRITLYGINNIFSNENPSTQIIPSGAGVYFHTNLIVGQNFGDNSLDTDPLFLSMHPDSLGMLKNNSPCIGAGLASTTLGGVVLTAPLFDYFNTPRPRESGSKPDLGAVENDLSNPVSSVKNIVDGVPTSFGLSQNYPNPFNPTTTIRYALPSSANVKLVVHDLLGREIATLVNEEQSAGWKEVKWNAKDVSSGIYFYKLTAGNFVETKKCLVVK